MLHALFRGYSTTRGFRGHDRACGSSRILLPEHPQTVKVYLFVHAVGNNDAHSGEEGMGTTWTERRFHQVSFSQRFPMQMKHNSLV